jgi:DNA-binding NtrC family response regulator
MTSDSLPIENNLGMLGEKLAHLNIVGQSPKFVACIDKINRFAMARAPILITGETGTGKEVAARALHYLGPRSTFPFVPVNCGALPDQMFENELFGHIKGAYTDAKEKSPGLVTIAEKGTLFLDEVDSLPLKSQTALLRFLQDQIYRPLGDNKYHYADVTVISATNTDLVVKVAQQTFRQDLLFRLNTIIIELPPLRERREDIPAIANHYMYRLSELYGTPIKTLSQVLLNWLAAQNWPGNVRELENFLHRQFLLADGDQIDFVKADKQSEDNVTLLNISPECLKKSYDEAKKILLHEFERQFLHQIMEKTQGNLSYAARLVNKDRRSLGRLLKKNGIDRSDYLH